MDGAGGSTAIDLTKELRRYCRCEPGGMRGHAVLEDDAPDDGDNLENDDTWPGGRGREFDVETVG